MLILEGADHLGKTTLAKSLKLRYEHMGIPESGFDYYRDYLYPITPHVVADRFHLGAMVYGHLLKLHPVCPEFQSIHDAVDYEIKRDCNMFVIYTSDESWYHDHLTKGGKDEAYKVADIMKANRLFPAIAPDWAITIDIKNGAFEQVRRTMELVLGKDSATWGHKLRTTVSQSRIARGGWSSLENGPEWRGQ